MLTRKEPVKTAVITRTIYTCEFCHREGTSDDLIRQCELDHKKALYPTRNVGNETIVYIETVEQYKEWGWMNSPSARHDPLCGVESGFAKAGWYIYKYDYRHDDFFFFGTELDAYIRQKQAEVQVLTEDIEKYRLVLRSIVLEKVA